MPNLAEQWIEVFRAGDYGEKGRFQPEDLDRMAADYNPAEHEAPVVIGHPAEDAPAWAWVEKLRRQGESLWAKLRQVQPEFEDMVRRGLFTKRSVALYPQFEKTGRPYLRHLGFLGAAAPHVKGLQPIQLSEGEFVSIDFKEEETMDMKEIGKTVDERIRAFFSELFGKKQPEGATFTEEQVKQLAAQAAAEAVKPLKEENAQLRRQFEEGRTAATGAEVRAFIEQLRSKKVAPRIIALAEPLAAHLAAAAATLAFSEKGADGKPAEKKLGAFELFAQLLSENAAMVPTDQVAGNDVPQGKLVQFAAPGRNQEIDPESISLAERAAALELEIRKEQPKLSDTEVASQALVRARKEIQAGSIAAGQV